MIMAAHMMEWLTIFPILHFFQGRNCHTRGFLEHSHLRDEELVQLLPFTFHTSCVPEEGVQHDPLAEPRLDQGLDPCGSIRRFAILEINLT